MTTIATFPIFPAPVPAETVQARRRPGRVESAARDASFAAAFLLAATAMLAAEEIESWTQAWIPGVLRVPADAEVLRDRAIGSSVRMFSIATDEDAEALLGDWEAALRTDGYVIEQEAGQLMDRSIEFSGAGIANAKIVAAPTNEDGRTVLEFDATLR